MLNLAFKENENYENLIFHSDQGWQYQHYSYQERLKEKKITQSMSRKGNSLDNGLMECFFGLLKSEMFYEQEEKYKTLEELKEAIEDYIYYYNNKRIKEKLLGNLLKLKKEKVNLMVTGATGCGKSSTINALFGVEVAKVGTSVDPETMEIEKYEFVNGVLANIEKSKK